MSLTWWPFTPPLALMYFTHACTARVPPAIVDPTIPVCVPTLPMTMGPFGLDVAPPVCVALVAPFVAPAPVVAAAPVLPAGSAPTVASPAATSWVVAAAVPASAPVPDAA